VKWKGAEHKNNYKWESRSFIVDNFKDVLREYEKSRGMATLESQVEDPEELVDDRSYIPPFDVNFYSFNLFYCNCLNLNIYV